MSDKLDKLIGGRYLVVRLLRQTHLCETFIAQDTQLPGNPLCVVKQLKPQSSEEFVLKTAQRLFDNEANVLYKLGSHAQIPRLLAHLQVGDQFYLVQEFIQGKDLSQEEIIPDNQQLWTEEKVRSFLLDVLKILAFVHKNNVIHRDIKPSNLIRRDDGKIVLIDFGAVKEITNMTLTEGQTNIDQTVVVGTPGYMPREQHLGKPRFNSDIYALGMTAINGITGFHPDQLPRDDETENIIWRDRAPQCSSQLADIIDKMVCANSSVKRYQNANEVLLALENPKPEDKTQKTSKKAVTSANTNPQKRTWKFWLGIIVTPIFIGAVIFSPRIWRAIQALNYYTEGNSLIQEGNAAVEKEKSNQKYEGAIIAFEKAIRIKPNFVQAWTNKGFAEGKLVRPLDKFASCAQATNVAPDFAEAWNCRGLARFDLQQYEAAMREYEQAIAVDPNFYRAWYNKGQAYLTMGQYQEAITATRRVLAIEPDYFWAWTQICQALYELEEYQDAQAHCQESLAINPQHQTTIDLLEKIDVKLQ
ncbi:Serine/threonine protein kinase [Hyella patelloides LEGE 07179]|uniref:non-specific serine/threonine protein kinase n=1 Tax=Hyella patelloides LEGE 07179 TaxID=945734 RepID=A0A563VUA7_9CYAN|nr:serine/threonine-protein kinase [Hyella patelloides]VEP14969.1 Serine/threonine protein kinase [Hyella patelloides LEGE 07179]